MAIPPDLPRSVDHVPHGPQRAVALGLVVLALAGVIVHKDLYRGFPQRAARAEQAVVQTVGRFAHGVRHAPPSAVRESTESVSPLVAN